MSQEGVYVYLDNLATPTWVKVDKLSSYPVVLESATPESATPGTNYYEGLPIPSEGDIYSSGFYVWDYTSGTWVARDMTLDIPQAGLDYLFNAKSLTNELGGLVTAWNNEGDAGGSATGSGILRGTNLNGHMAVEFNSATHSMILPGGHGDISNPWSFFVLFQEQPTIDSNGRVFRGGNTIYVTDAGAEWTFYVGSALGGPTDREALRTYAMVVTTNGGIGNFHWATAPPPGQPGEGSYETYSVGVGGHSTANFSADTVFFNHDTSPSASNALGLVGAWGLYDRELSNTEANAIITELMTKWGFSPA